MIAVSRRNAQACVKWPSVESTAEMDCGDGVRGNDEICVNHTRTPSREFQLAMPRLKVVLLSHVNYANAPVFRAFSDSLKMPAVASSLRFSYPSLTRGSGFLSNQISETQRTRAPPFGGSWPQRGEHPCFGHYACPPSSSPRDIPPKLFQGRSIDTVVQFELPLWDSTSSK